MGGLDKIVDRITGEAAERAKAILAEAKASADSITAEGSRKTAEECERIKKKAESEAKSITDRSKASAELKTKQILLAGKQELINSAVNMAREKLSTLSDEEYIELFVKLFDKHIPSEKAVMRLGSADLERMPVDVISSLMVKAVAAGGDLRVAEEPADIRNGFILDFGGILENCTFDALIDQNLDDLMDTVKSILFA